MNLMLARNKLKSQLLGKIRTRFRKLHLVPPDVDVFLFGSFSGEKWDGHSDIDLAIIINNENKEIQSSINHLFMDPGVTRSVDIAVFKKKEFDRSGIRSSVLSGIRLL